MKNEMTVEKSPTCEHAFMTGKGRWYCKKSLADKDDCGEYKISEEIKKAFTSEPKSDVNDVLDKIITEIEEAQTYDGIYIDRAYVLDIIYKYREEE